jgi:hypothetical protein
VFGIVHSKAVGNKLTKAMAYTKARVGLSPLKASWPNLQFRLDVIDTFLQEVEPMAFVLKIDSCIEPKGPRLPEYRLSCRG